MDHSASKERLKKLIIQYSLQKDQAIQLASGKKSSLYFDGKQTSLHPEGSMLIGELLSELIQAQAPQTQAIGGPTLGADPLITTISLKAYSQGNLWPGFIIRKEPKGHGTQNWIEGKTHLKKGMKVSLVEDVITTGGSLIRAIENTRDWQFKILGAFVIVDREEGAYKNLQKLGIPLYSIFTKSDFT